MGVIVTGMDMPGKCADCKLTYLDTGDDAYFGANEYRCVIDDSVIDCNVSEKAYDCQLKSVEGLIEKIEQAKQNKGKSGNPIIDSHDIGLDRYFDFGLEKAIKIIKEYCGMEGNNDKV